MAKSIKFNFKSDHKWLSSFLPCCIILEDADGNMQMFSSAEHAFHWFKTDDQTFKDKIINAKDASTARYWGGAKVKCPMRKDWDKIKLKVMAKIVKAKFTQNLELAKLLIETKDKELIELAPWDKEGFWGTGNDGSGENNLGKIIMKRRKSLIKWANKND